jgi:hypothetical protein
VAKVPIITAQMLQSASEKDFCVFCRVMYFSHNPTANIWNFPVINPPFPQSGIVVSPVTYVR